MDLMYHICDYQDNFPKSADTWCQFQKDKQNNPTTTNHRVIYPQMLGEQFCLFINLFGSLRRWRNPFMAKPKTLTNCFTELFGIVNPDLMSKLVSIMPLATLIMVKKLPQILWNYLRLIHVRSVNMRRKRSSIYVGKTEKTS